MEFVRVTVSQTAGFSHPSVKYTAVIRGLGLHTEKPKLPPARPSLHPLTDHCDRSPSCEKGHTRGLAEAVHCACPTSRLSPALVGARSRYSRRAAPQVQVIKQFQHLLPTSMVGSSEDLADDHIDLSDQFALECTSWWSVCAALVHNDLFPCSLILSYFSLPYFV
jgi:hypothetical protein